MLPVNVLVNPAHYLIDDSLQGSEYTWVASILKGLAECEKYYLHIITGAVESFSDDSHYYKIYEILPSIKDKNSLLRRLYFLFKKSATSRLLNRKNDVRIIHHMLPYWLGVTFDPDFIIRDKSKAYLIGPIQSPHLDTLSDSLVTGTDKLVYTALKRASGYLSKLTLRKADSIVTINTHTREVLLKMGIEAGKIDVIPPGIDTDKFRFMPFEEKDQERIIIITVGHLVKRKGTELLIKAMSDVARKQKNVELSIVGDGPESRSLKDLTRDLGLDDVVTFRGSIPHHEVCREYERSHIFVSMSLDESWGQVYLEAMACGLPVITTKNTGSNAIIRNGEFGYLIEQGSHNMLLDRLSILIENKQMISEFGRKARQEAVDRYDWKRVIIPRYVGLYDSLIRRVAE